MDWLHPFVALTLCCGLVLTLLPEGTLRRTAALVIGLMLTLCWADSVLALLHLPPLPDLPDTALTMTGYDAQRAWEDYASTLGGE